LHPDEEVALHIVETDWCDEPPIVKPEEKGIKAPRTQVPKE
jgi:hypothetical protein